MPKLTIEGHGIHDVATGTRLVLAIRDAGVDISHRCGGFAGCTTCRVEFLAGEPGRMTAAEQEKAAKANLGDHRLACQIAVDHDMAVKPLLLVSEQAWSDPGPDPAESIEPSPEWVER